MLLKRAKVQFNNTLSCYKQAQNGEKFLVECCSGLRVSIDLILNYLREMDYEEIKRDAPIKELLEDLSFVPFREQLVGLATTIDSWKEDWFDVDLSAIGKVIKITLAILVYVDWLTSIDIEEK